MNKSEAFVYSLCRKSFLSLWSIANPQGKKRGKELCDILVVCEPDIVIFSVKEIKYKPSGDVKKNWGRWTSKAIEDSAEQLYGADRVLKVLKEVKRKDGSIVLSLPPPSERGIHRVAVALGSKGEIPMYFGDLGRGFIHVFDEQTVRILLRELDTITDFVKYLSAKERLFSSGKVSSVITGEENLLALYFHKGRTFPSGFGAIVIDEGLWAEVSAKEEFRARKEADRESYFWDELIEHLITGLKCSFLAYQDPKKGAERLVRTMAREDRFARRILAKAFREFMDLAATGEVRSRIVPSPSGVIYVFLARPVDHDRRKRMAELAGRCFIARGLNKSSKVVIGLATEQYAPGQGFSFDAYCLKKEDWTEEDQKKLQQLQSKTGAFISPRCSRFSEDEYPRMIE